MSTQQHPIQIFSAELGSAKVHLRVINHQGCALFIAKDVCQALEIANHRDAISVLEDDEKAVGKADTLGGAQDMACVTESGLYALIFRSNKPSARNFRKWVTAEVLPSLRQHGTYSLPESIGEHDTQYINWFLNAVKMGEEYDSAELSDAFLNAHPEIRSWSKHRVTKYINAFFSTQKRKTNGLTLIRFIAVKAAPPTTTPQYPIDALNGIDDLLALLDATAQLTDGSEAPATITTQFFLRAFAELERIKLALN